MNWTTKHRDLGLVNWDTWAGGKGLRGFVQTAGTNWVKHYIGETPLGRVPVCFSQQNRWRRQLYKLRVKHYTGDTPLGCKYSCVLFTAKLQEKSPTLQNGWNTWVFLSVSLRKSEQLKYWMGGKNCESKRPDLITLLKRGEPWGRRLRSRPAQNPNKQSSWNRLSTSRKGLTVDSLVPCLGFAVTLQFAWHWWHLLWEKR